MAYVVSVASSQESVATTTFVMSNPAGVQVGDYLVAICSQDGTGATITSNWTIPGSGELTAGSIRMAVAYTRVTSLPASRCTFTGSSDEWTGCVFCIRDAYYNTAPSDFIDIVGSNSASSGPPYNMTGLNVNYANSLILFGVGVDGAVNPTPSTGGVVVVDAQDANTVSFLGGWYTEPTDGVADTIGFTGTLTTNVLVFLQLAIRNATNGRVGVCPAAGVHDLIDTGYHRERAAAAISNETSTANFLGWEIRNPTYVFRDDGGSFTNITTAATNDSTADVAWRASEVVNDAMYIGHANPFNSLVVNRASCTAGVGGVFAIEYYNGTTWVAVPSRFDQTSNFTSAVADRQVIQWRRPADGTTTTVNGQSAYWIRLRITTVWSTNPTVSRIYIGEAGLAYDAYGAVPDNGIVPFWSANGITPSTTNFPCHTGAIRDFGTNINLTGAGRYLLGTYFYTAPREYYDTGDAASGYGVRFPLLDSSNNYKSWIIGGFAYPQTSGDNRNFWAVQPAQTVATHHSVSTTPPSFSVARKWVLEQGSFSDEVNHIQHSMMVYVNQIVLYGGASGTPATWADVKTAINGLQLPYLVNGQLNAPIVFGGSKALFVDVNLATFDFVRVAGSVYGGMFHIDEGILGVVIKASAGDIIKIRNSTITSESRIRFEVDSASSASATYDFTGTTVVNATVTLRALTFSGMSFINCPTFTQNGATLTNCKFTDTKVTSSTLANMALISGSTFTSSGTGHAIEVSGSAGTITFTGNTFSGYAGVNGSTGNEAIYVNIASGNVVINISGGTTPSIRTAGATVTVNNNITLTLTGLVSGSDIVILDAGTNTERVNVDEHGSTTYNYSYTDSGASVDIGVFKAGYIPFYIRGYTLPASNGSVPINQVVDRYYID
jgi:hypothetical protein